MDECAGAGRTIFLLADLILFCTTSTALVCFSGMTRSSSPPAPAPVSTGTGTGTSEGVVASPSTVPANGVEASFFFALRLRGLDEGVGVVDVDKPGITRGGSTEAGAGLGSDEPLILDVASKQER